MSEIKRWSFEVYGYKALSIFQLSAATIIFFTLFDPTQLGIIGGFPDLTRMGGYTIGFFCFWLLTSISCALTCYFRRPTNRPTDSN